MRSPLVVGVKLPVDTGLVDEAPALPSAAEDGATLKNSLMLAWTGLGFVAPENVIVTARVPPTAFSA